MILYLSIKNHNPENNSKKIIKNNCNIVGFIKLIRNNLII